MKTIKIDIKVPSKREYDRLLWTLREAKKFQMVQSVKDAMLLEDTILRGAEQLLLEIGGRHYPENCYIQPIVSTLRQGGWIKDECVVVLRSNKELEGITISI